jgi:outer membrane protein assembly factor BamA
MVNGCRKSTMMILLALEFASLEPPRAYALIEDKAPSLEGTRIELIEKQQEEKERILQAAKPPRIEQALDKYVGEDPLHKYMGGIPGLRLRLGGMPSGAGFGFGPEYFRPDLARGRLSFRATAIGTKKLWYRLETELSFPRLAGQHLNLGFRGRRMDDRSIAYYGPGPNSERTGRRDYRREESSAGLFLDFKPFWRYLCLGFSAEYTRSDVGIQKRASLGSQPALIAAPDINARIDHLRTGPFLEVDTRDKPEDPHGGTHFYLGFNQFGDRTSGRYSFRQVGASLEQYFPFFNRKRVIAIRARSVLSYPQTGSEVPFFMQPTLGGTSDLRGYKRYRFYDNNSFLITAEYRWEIFTLMDAALFGDAGKVFHKDGEFSLRGLESDFGFGLRFKSRQAVVFRIDTAFSHEGIGLWLTFDHVF